jgi:hypothetical protein
MIEEFIHTAEANDFLDMIKLIDEKSAQKFKEDLDKILLDEINANKKLVSNKKFDISHLTDTYQIVQCSYLMLYQDGLTDIITKMIKKCGSVSYVFDLFDHYLNQYQFHVQYTLEKFLETAYMDNDYINEFRAIHLSLKNSAALLFPGNGDMLHRYKLEINPDHAKGKKEVLSDLILSFQLYNGFSPGKDTGYRLYITIDLRRFSQSIIVQFIQLFNNAKQYNQECVNVTVYMFKYEKVIYDVGKTLEYLKAQPEK